MANSVQDQTTLPDLSHEITAISGTYFAFGANSDVHSARWTPPDSPPRMFTPNESVVMVAIKIFRQNDEDTLDDIERRFKREWSIWFKLQHKNILPLLGTFVQADTGRIGLVSPYRSETDIGAFLKNHKTADRKNLLRGIINGLRYIHSKGYSHGDLKPRNVLVSKSDSAEGEWIAEIGDFGGSRTRLRGNGDTTAFKFTPRYTSLELLNNERNENVTPKSDVYSFAMTMLQILTDDIPFPKIRDNVQLLTNIILSKKPILPNREDYPAFHGDSHHWKLMSDCWNPNPEERPSMEEVAERF